VKDKKDDRCKVCGHLDEDAPGPELWKGSSGMEFIKGKADEGPFSVRRFENSVL